MLVTLEVNRRNKQRALAATCTIAIASAVAGWFVPPLLSLLLPCPLVYWWTRRRCLRRLALMRQPFPPAWEQILRTHVAYFNSLNDADKTRFKQMANVFLHEVQITGVRTDVDDTIRVLVAASAVIPVFGFHDWDYHRLNEVLVYPASFSDAYQMKGAADENILGLVGQQHLSGTMILSKPALLAGFDNRTSKENVGIHEFTHLVESEEADYGLPPEVPVEVVKQWIQYVAKELAHPSTVRSGISDYAYTNEHEFFAVLSEYFFKSPDLLRRKNPKLYQMLRTMFHQDRR